MSSNMKKILVNVLLLVCISSVLMNVLPDASSSVAPLPVDPNNQHNLEGGNKNNKPDNSRIIFPEPNSKDLNDECTSNGTHGICTINTKCPCVVTHTLDEQCASLPHSVVVCCPCLGVEDVGPPDSACQIDGIGGVWKKESQCTTLRNNMNELICCPLSTSSTKNEVQDPLAAYEKPAVGDVQALGSACHADGSGGVIRMVKDCHDAPHKASPQKKRIICCLPDESDLSGESTATEASFQEQSEIESLQS